MTDPEISLKDRKAQLRQSATARRAKLFGRDASSAAQVLAGYADKFTSNSGQKVVSGYVPIGSEINGMALLTALYERGFTIGLPLVTASAMPLTFLHYCPGDPLIKGSFGVLTPEHCAKQVIPSILLVPLLAFDRFGFRLGYGGGFYDRSLAILKQNGPVTAIGLAFSGQEVDAVPHDELDQPLDGVLCEDGFREFTQSTQVLKP